MSEKRVVVVTGAAGFIGKAIVTSFLEAGDSVIASDYSEELLKEAYQDEIKSKADLQFEVADMSKSQEVRALGKRLKSKHERIDVLVNNAGVNKRTPIGEVTSEEWDYVVNVNLRGPFELIQELLEVFIGQKSGRIINFSSSAAKVGGDVVGIHYTAAKAGILGMTLKYAKHLAPYSVTVNSILPGPIDTAFHAETPAEQKKKIAGIIPVGRWGQPDEVAAAVFFLASEKAAFITGENLDINGGIIMD